MSNKLVDEAKKIYEKELKRRNASIIEENLTFFFVMLLTALMPFLSFAFCGKLPVGGSITIAVLSLITVIVLFVAGKKRKQKFFYYICYVLSAACLAFSCCAVLKHYELKPDFVHTLIFAAALVAFSLADLLIMSAGKGERWFMLAMSGVMVLTFILVGIIASAWSTKNGFGWIYLFFGIAFIMLHLFGTIYVFNGNEFFLLTVFGYYFIALFALIIALSVIGGCDSCDCGSVGGGVGGGSNVKKKGRRVY